MSTLTVLLGVTFSASAMYCPDLLLSTGTVRFLPDLLELPPEQWAAIEKQVTSLVSVPRVIEKNGSRFLIYPNMPKGDAQIMAEYGPEPYARPTNMEVVKGFVQKAYEGGTLPKEVIATPGESRSYAPSIYSPKYGFLSYEFPGNSPQIIRLAPAEEVMSVARIQNNQRLVVTSRLEQEIGFDIPAHPKMRKFVISFYHFEANGQTTVSFSVKGHLDSPAISFTQHPDVGVILNVEGMHFQVQLKTAQSSAGQRSILKKSSTNVIGKPKQVRENATSLRYMGAPKPGFYHPSQEP